MGPDPVDHLSDADTARDLTRYRLTATELARALGVSKSSVTRWASAGRVPCVRLANTRLLRFDLDEVAGALKGVDTMNAIDERNRRIRQEAMERAEQTWVAETATGTIVICHPGQSTDVLQDPEKLRQDYGIVDVSCIRRLSESRDAPTPYSVDDQIARLENELAELKIQRQRRVYVEDNIVAAAQEKLAEARAEAKPDENE